jgi:hypothetical protein
MIKLNQTNSVTVVEEAQLGQVVGGNRGGHHRWRKYNHCYDRRRYNDCYSSSSGYESKDYGSDYSDSDYDCYNEYDYCDRSYS